MPAPATSLSDPSLPLAPELAEQLSEGVAIYRPDGTCLSLNTAMEALLGLPRAQVVGRVLWERFPAATACQQAFLRVAAGGPREELEHRYTPEGPVYAHRLYLAGGCVVVMARGLSEEHRALEALRMQERILERMSDAVFLCDDQGVIRYCNPAADRLFGYEPGQLVGRSGAILNDYPPEENARQVGAILHELRTRGEWEGDFRNRRRDGRTFITRARITAVELGGRLHFMSVQQDMTERDREEDHARRLQEASDALSGALTQAQVAAVALDAVHGAAGASLLAVYLPGAEGGFTLAESRGASEAALAPYRHLPPDTALPVASALRRGEPLWYADSVRFARDFPVHTWPGSLDDLQSLAVLPFFSGGRPHGGLVLVFSSPQPLDASQRRFLGALAAQCGHAFERARLYDAEHAARARAEALAHSLQQSEEVFRSFFDVAGVAMARVDARAGSFARVNAAYCELVGYTEEELLGRHVLEMSHPEDRPPDVVRLQQLMRGELPLYVSEKRYVRKDGSLRWVIVYATLVRTPEGRPLQVAAVVQDITERKRAEAAKVASERQLRSITDALPVLVSYVDRELRYQMMNQAYEDWSGIPREALLGRPLSELLGEEGLERVLPHARAALAGEAQVFELEILHREEPRPVRITYLPQRSPSGEVEGFVALLVDISEDVRRVRERNQLLQEAEAAVRLRDEFLSVASHELRTPLTSLSLQMQLLGRALPPEARERGRVATAERQVARLKALVESLLDVSQLAAGRLELQPVEADLAALTHDALERMAPVFANGRSAVRFERPEAPVRGMWDAHRLDQVLVNLLSNAAKYGAGKPVHVCVRREDGHATVAVRDEGIGIPRTCCPASSSASSAPCPPGTMGAWAWASTSAASWWRRWAAASAWRASPGRAPPSR